MIEKFKVKKKHLIGEIAGFPKRVVQAMVDEQVRQGNPANPIVFAGERVAGKSNGGFDWHESPLGRNFWVDIIRGKQFHLIPSAKNRVSRLKWRAAKIAMSALNPTRLSNTC